MRDVTSALNELRRAASDGKPYDLFFADAVRAESPGVKLAAAINSYQELASTRVILLVSTARRGEVDGLNNAAVRATLIKPVTARSLRVALSKALLAKEATASMTVPKGSEWPAQRSLDILVAEDNAVNQRLIRLNLETWGHRVTVASDGALAAEATNVKCFDLILMDLQMPRMSGFEATMEIRKQERKSKTNHVPVLALSANVLKGVRGECIQSGMDGYVSKPVRQHELLDAMSRLVPEFFADASAGAAFREVLATRPTSSAQASAEIFTVTEFAAPPLKVAPTPITKIVHSPAPVAIVQPPPTVPVSVTFDSTALMENLGGDKSMLAEVVLLSRDTDVPRILADLSAALKSDDILKISKAAHALKGMVGAFNATEAWTLSARLEASAREVKRDVIPKQIEEAVQALRMLLLELEEAAEIEHSPLTWG